MSERRHLVAAVLLVGGLALRLMTLSACGGSTDNEFPIEVAFTPTPTIMVVRDCGDGVLGATEVCDMSAPNGDATCTAQGKSCLCCACLGDDEPLGTRTFSVARPGSAFRSSGLSCNDVAGDPWLPGPLVLQAGRPDPETCIAPLTLAEDAIIGFRQPLGIACLKLIAAESEGSIDCDGGTPYDVEYTQDSNQAEPDSPQVVTRGLGDPTQTGASGAADLALMNRVTINVQGVFNPNECLTINYDDPTSDPRIKPGDISTGPLAFTTRNGRAIVLEPVGGGGAADCPGEGAEFSGTNFSCGRWSQEDSEGVLIAPLTALGQLNGAIDTANIMVITDQATTQ